MLNSYIPLSIKGVPVTIAEPVLFTSSVKRTWKERLFTFPFTPLKKTKEVEAFTEALVDGQILKTEHGLVMNAKTFNECEKAIFSKSKENK